MFKRTLTVRDHTSPSPVPLVVVAALGYFVDIYDLQLFNVIKQASLTELGLSGDAYKLAEVALFNWQMAGMLVGGLLFGMLGDLKGRASALFGSILLYSIGNIANAFVSDLDAYQICRFIVGLGLAGELGAGVTLVNETMGRENRGWGTVAIVGFGTLGAVAAFTVGSMFGWRNAFIVGGALGLTLLLVRMRALESGMFQRMSETKVGGRGNFLRIFTRKGGIRRYLASIGIGLPIWYAVGVLVALCARFAEVHGITGIQVGKAVMLAYIGISSGDLVSGFLSQKMRSRRKVILAYLVFLTGIGWHFLTMGAVSPFWFYTYLFLIGFGVGYWALFVTVASELFGTNLRSTVSNTVPNFVRGAVIPITLSFQALSPQHGISGAAMVVGAVCLGLAFLSLLLLEETFGKDLDFTE